MLKTLVISATCAWFAIAAYAYIWQARLVFHPTRSLPGTPAERGYDYTDVWLKTSDGVSIHAWHVIQPDAAATVLFFHGNGGNIADRPQTLARLHEMGANILMVDYRGYGRSEGSPDERGTYADASAAWSFLTEDLGLPSRDIVIYGRSLGGAVALELAARVVPRAVIVESTFTSLAAMARTHYPYLPTGLLLRFEYPSEAYITQVRAPILVAHSPQDALIPYGHGETLFSRAASPKRFYELRGGHNEAFIRAGQPYYDTLAKFIKQGAAIDRRGPLNHNADQGS